MKVKTKVDVVPLDALTLVLFLLEHKHSAVKQLLEFLIGVVNAELLKAVDLCDNMSNRSHFVCRGTLKISKPAMSRMPMKERLSRTC